MCERRRLYYLARGSGAVYRVRYGAVGPGITTHPADRTVSPGQSATFSVVASGTAPFTYQWQRNNVNIPGATGASYTLNAPQLGDSGARSGSTSATASAISTATRPRSPSQPTSRPRRRSPPRPPDTDLQRGQTIAFAGTGTDPEDGARPASAFSWRVDFHHDTHMPPVPADDDRCQQRRLRDPDDGETSANVWYRLFLTVTDSGGRTSTVSATSSRRW